MNLLYNYAEARPLHFTDWLGLWKVKNCNRDQAKILANEIRKAKQVLRDPKNPCQLCGDKSAAMMSSISDSTYHCVENGSQARTRHRMGPEDCASVYDDNKQTTNPGSIAIVFYNPDSKPPVVPLPCSCISGTILHEASHNVLGTHDYTGFKNSAPDFEYRCNACGEH